MQEKIDSPIFLDWRNIHQYTRNDKEYTFVDKAEVYPGKSAKGMKLVSGQDWYFRIHLPDDPIMPGVFIMEAIMTTGAFALYVQEEFKNRKFIFRSADKVKIYGSVRPGDILQCEAELVSYRRGLAKFCGRAFVDTEKICDMEFALIEPFIIKEYTV